MNLWNKDDAAAPVKDASGNDTTKLQMYLDLQGRYLDQGKMAGIINTGADIGKLKAVDIPINGSGTIAVHGTMNAATAITLSAANIDVSKSGATNAPLLQTGVIFNNTVNTGDNKFISATAKDWATNRLKATADAKGNIILTDPNSSLTGDGSINLRATTDEVNYNSMPEKAPDYNTKKAEVTVGEGAVINAAGNVEISSQAVAEYDLKDFHFMLEDKDIIGFKNQLAQTLAKTTVNGKVTGADVNISAKAESTITSTGSAVGARYVSELMGQLPQEESVREDVEKARAFLDQLNGLNTSIGIADSDAQVTIGEKAELKANFVNNPATGKPYTYEKPNEEDKTKKDTVNVGGNVNINAIGKTATDNEFTVDPNKEKTKKEKQGESNPITVLINGGFVWEKTGANAVTTVDGKANITSKGNIVIGANSTNSVTAEVGIEEADDEKTHVPAYLVATVGLVNQNNNAKVVLSGSNDTASINAGGGLIVSAVTDTSTSSTIGSHTNDVSFVGTAVNIVKVDSKATVENNAKLSGGFVSVSANDVINKFKVATSNFYGPEYNLVDDAMGAMATAAKKLVGGAAAAQRGDDVVPTAGSWNEYINVGSAVAVVNANNQAKVDLQAGSVLNALGGVNVNSGVTLVDSSVNTSSILATEMQGVKAGVSAAVAVENMTNTAETVVADGVQLTTATGDVSVTAGVEAGYNRPTIKAETLKACVELARKDWEKLPADTKKIFQTQWESLVTALDALATGKIPADSPDFAQKVFEAQDAIEKMEGRIEDKLKGIFGVIDTLKSYVDASGWANMYTAAVTSSKVKENTPKAMVTGTVGIQNVTNKANVTIGSNAKLSSGTTDAPGNTPKGKIKTAANTNTADVQVSGKWFVFKPIGVTAGGEASIGATVGIQKVNSESEVIVKNGAVLSGGEVDVTADNKVMNVGGAVGGAKAGTLGVTGMTTYLSGNSKSIVNVDDDAVLSASRAYGMVDKTDGTTGKEPGDQATGKINITADNNTILSSLVGETTAAEAAAIGASVGVINYDIYSKALVANIEEVDTAGAAAWSANGVDTTAKNNGVINTLTVAGVSAAGQKSAAGAERGGVNVNVPNDPANQVNLNNAGVNAGGIDPNGAGNPQADPPVPANPPQAVPDPDPAPDPDNGNGAAGNEADNNAHEASKVNIAVAGSVSWNSIDERTEAKLSQVTVNMTPTVKAADYKGANPAENKKINVAATDSTFIGAYSGASALTKAGNTAGNAAAGNEGSGGGFAGSLSGAVAVNNIYKNTSAVIDSATINDELEVNNKAENSGAQVAAGIALGRTLGDRTKGAGFNVDASGSFNFIKSTVNSQVKDSRINSAAAANLNNTAYDKDVQVAGGLSFNYTKTSAGVGAAIAVNMITNTITADLTGNTLGATGSSLGAVNNLAVSKLTQVGGATSLGIVPRDGSRTYVTANAAVAVNTLTNTLNATGSDNTIYAQKLDVEVRDGKLSTSEADNEYIAQLKKEGFDVDNDAGKIEAVRNATEGKDIGVETNEDGSLKTNKETVDTEKDKGDKETVKYSQTNASVSNGGNTIVGSALNLTFKNDDTSGASIGAAVAHNKIDNDFMAKLSGGSVNITAADTEKAPSVKVAANSDTLQVGVSAGVAVQASGKGVKGAAAAGSVTIQRAENGTTATLENVNITADHTEVTALNKSTQTTVAGLASVSGANAALGMTWAQNNLNNITGAYVKGITLDKFSADAAKTANLKVDSQNTSKTLAVGASVGTAFNTTGSGFSANANGAYAANKGVNSTEAVIDKYEKDSTTKRNTITNAGNVSATAIDTSNLKGIAGSISVTAGKAEVGVAVGGAVVNNDIGTAGAKQKIRAEINEADITTAAAGTVKANATNNASILAVGAGGAVAGGDGAIEVSAMGSVATSAIYTDTVAGMTNTSIDKDDSSKHNAAVNVTATSNNRIISTADGLSVSVNTGLVSGATSVAVSKVTSKADTKAIISGGTQNVQSELVKAASDAKITDVATAISTAVAVGFVGADASANVAINNIGNDVIAKIMDGAVVNAYDNLGVLAESSDTLRNYGGAVSVGVSAKAGVSLGATVVVNKITGDTDATIDGSSVSAKGADGGTISVKEYEATEEKAGADNELSSVGTRSKTVAKKGVVVNADAQHTLNDISVTAGVGASAFAGVGFNATVINNTIGGHTTAEITKTNVNNTLADLTDNSNVAVQANDRLKVSSHAGNLSVGAAGVGGVSASAAVDVNNFNRTTTAAITGTAADNRNTVNANAASVKAFGSTDLLITESGLGVGAGYKVGVGATGVVSKNKFTNDVTAAMSNVNGQQNQVDIDADSVKLLRAYTNGVSLSGGIGTLGAAASVINTTDTSTTQAELKDSKLTTNESKKDSTAEADKSRVNVAANNHAVLGSQTAGGALAIGLGAAVGVTVANNNLTNTVATYVTNAELGRSADAYKEFSAKADNTFTDKFLNVSVGGGVLSVGVGVANNIINSSALTNITGGTVYADGIDISAKENRTIREKMVGVTIGGGAINTNVSTTTIGGALLDTYEDKTADGKDANYSTADIQNLSLEADMKAQDLDNLLAVMKQTEGMFTAKDETELTYDKGAKSQGIQTILNGAVLKSSGNVNIESYATTNTNVQVDQAAVGGLAVGVASLNTTVGTDNGVTVKGGDLQGQNVSIQALSGGTLKQETTQVGAGGVEVKVSVSKVTREGQNLITIGDNANDTIIRAGIDKSAVGTTAPTLTILAQDSTVLDNYGVTGSASAVSGTAQVIKAFDHSDNKVEIKGKADLAAYDYIVKDEVFQWEPGRAGSLKDADGNVLYNIINTTNDGKDVATIRDGAGNPVRIIEYSKVSDTTDKYVVKDGAGVVQYTAEYTKPTTEGGTGTTVFKDKDGNEISDTSNIKSPWDLTYTSQKLELGTVDIKAVNSNRINAELRGGSLSGVGGSGIVVLAEEGKRAADGTLEKGTTGIKVEGANTFVGKDVTLASENEAMAYAKEDGGGLSILSASVIKTTANLQGAVNTIVGDGQTFGVENLHLSAEASQPVGSGKYSAEAYTKAVGTGGVNVAVNHAYAQTGLDTKLSVGAKTYKTVKRQEAKTDDTYGYVTDADGKTVKDKDGNPISELKNTVVTLAGDKLVEGGTNLDLKAQSTVITKSNVTGINGNIVAVGSNNAYTENKNTVTLDFNPGTYKAGSLTLEAGVTDNISTTANGDGGSVVGVSPYAARTVHTNASATTINLSGSYELEGDMNVKATTGVVQDMLASAVQATIAGGSGTIGESNTNNRAQVNLAAGTSIKAGGKVDIGAFNKVDFNTIREYAVKGNGFGGVEMAVAKMKNEVTTNSQVNLNNAQIVSDGAQTYSAETNNNIKSQVYVLSAGVIAGAHGENTIDVKANDSISQLTGGLLKVSGKDADIAIGAVDNQILNTRAMADNVGGAVAGSSAISNNNVTRTNTVNIDGKIFSRHDVKLYAGQGADGAMGEMKLVSSAEAMTIGLIPVALPPRNENKFIQTNTVNVNTGGEVQAIRNVYLYADAGKENTDLFTGRYTMYAGKGKSTYAATTNGITNVKGQDGVKDKTADNVITVNGMVLAGAGNVQNYTIGTAGMLVVTSKDQYDVVKAYYDTHGGFAEKTLVLVLSDADYAEVKEGSSTSVGDTLKTAGYNIKKLSEIITMDDGAANYSGLTAADFKLGAEGYAVAKLARLRELECLMSDNQDSDRTAYAGYKADYERIISELQKEKLVQVDAAGKIVKILDDYTVNYIEIPDLAASGGNVIAQSRSFTGDGSVEAKGNPVVNLTNNTTLATKVNNITVYEPGGDIYYNNALLDTTASKDELKKKGVTVNELNSAHGFTSTVSIYGNNSITEPVNYRVKLSETDVRDEMIPVKADIFLQGQVVAEGGTVTVKSENDSIILEGKDAKDVAAVVGKTVSLTAGGSIQQGYKDDIENIGGDPQEQYGNNYNNYKYTNGTSGVYNQNKGVVAASKSRLSGDDIYINASDVNINGTVQSGYEKYYVELNAYTRLDANNNVVKIGTPGAITLEQRIAQITEANGGKIVTDESVVGNPLYQVVKGGEVKNANGYYDYRINVYYNPSGNDGKGKLLTENVDSKGGKVYITGRVSSTGSGEIFCLDGTYNIDVKNDSNYLLQTGKLVVNDVAGQVKITDTNQNTVTTITRNDDGTLNTKFQKIYKDEPSAERNVLDIAHGGYYGWQDIAEEDGGGTVGLLKPHAVDKYDVSYKPQSGLRYNWTNGYYETRKNTYRKTWYNARWGADKDEDGKKQAQINAEKELAPIATAPASTQAKRNGAYIGANSQARPGDTFDVIYTKQTLVNARRDISRRTWKQGVYGIHHYTELTWETMTGTANSFIASVKADNPVGIKFIGDSRANSAVRVYSEAGIIVGGDIGNRQLYETVTADNIARDEKGTVSLSAGSGAISQIGGNLYGQSVELLARGSMENISITAGDTVKLAADMLAKPDKQDISIFVNSNKEAKGDVLVSRLNGSAYTEKVLLQNSGNSGNINTKAGTVIKGKRIDLVSDNGSINALVNAGQTFVGTDPLAASVNATAKGDITLTQQSGDMRIGRIYSTDGDVTLNTTGSFVDALPYASNNAGTEEELVEKWLRAGIISDSTASKELQDASKEMIAEKDAALSKISKEYKEGVKAGFDRYKELKGKSDRSTDETKELEFWDVVFKGCSSADDYFSADKYSQGVRDAFARYEDLKGKASPSEAENMELGYWQEIFTNCASADDYLSKYGTAPQLDSKYQVWDKNALLYSIQQSIINQTADTLPTTSSKDPNVKGNNITLNATNNAGILSDTVTKMHVDTLGDSTVTDNLSKQNGLENLKTLARADASTVTWDSAADNGRGVITITQKLPIGVQTNKAEGKLTVGKYEGGTLKNLAGNAFLEGRTVKDATIEGNKDLTIDAIRATGNVSVTSLGAIINGATTGAAITAKDLNITAVGSIGAADNLITTDLTGTLRAIGQSVAPGDGESGGIYLANIGNGKLTISAVSTGGELKLHAKNDILMGDNTADVKGVIQTEHDGDIELISREGSIGSEDKLMLVKNSKDGEDDKRKVTVGAKNSIYLEGVSDAADQKTAGGQLNLKVEDVNGTPAENVQVNVNGTLKLLDDVTAKENLELNTVNTLNIDKNLKAENITLQAGEVTTVNGDKVVNKAASLQQSYTIDADGKTPVSGSIIEADNLTATSTGNLDLGSGFNKLNYVILDNRSDATANNSVVLGNAGTHGLTLEVHNTLDGQDDTVHGTLAITKYAMAAGATKVDDDMLLLNGAKATGNISVINNEDDIVNFGNFSVAGNGNINMTAAKDIFNGGVDAGRIGTMEITGAGNITLEAKTGSVYNYKGADMLAHNGQISLRATNDTYNIYYYDEQGKRVNIPEELYHKVNIDEDSCAMIDGKRRVIYIDGSVFNAGDTVALGDNAKIEMIAASGDVFNYDDFNTIDDESGQQTGILSNGAAISTGDVVMSAANGLIYNDKDIVSEKNVTLTAEEGLGSFGTSIQAGKDITLTATAGDLVNKAKLISEKGNIVLDAENGSVVNMLDGDVLALGGSVTMHAGQTVTDETGGKRPIYTVDSTGDMKKLDVDLEAGKMIVVDKYYLADGKSASTAVLIDDTVDTTALTKEQRDSIYGIISYVDSVIPGEGTEKPRAKMVVLRDEKGAPLKIMGDIEVFRKGDVVNRGDVVALGKTIEQPDGTLKPDESNKGTITLTSAHSNVSNYDNFAKVDGKEDYEFGKKKYLIAQGDIKVSAPEGYIYNSLNYIGNSKVEYDAKDDISIGKAATGGYAAGSLVVRSTEGKVTGTGDLIAGGGIVLDAAAGIILDSDKPTKLISDGGIIRLATESGGISLGAGSEILAGGSIDIGAKSGDVDLTNVSRLEAKEMLAVGTQDGNVKVNEITGKEVILYTNGTDKSVTANKINVEDHLLLRGDNIKLDDVNHTKDGWLHVDATGADGEAIKSNIAMDISGDTHFSTLSATTANINVLNSGQLAMDKLHITEKGYFNAMDYVTAVYGTTVSNDGSKAVYFDTGDGKGKTLADDLKLDKMLFGAYGADIDAGDAAPSYKKPVYVAEVRDRLASLGAYVDGYTKAGRDGWMNLYIDKPNFQRSNGVLLNIKGYYYANHQRYAANDFATMVADTKAANVYTSYYKDSIGMFDRYNLIDMPGLALVQYGDMQGNGLITVASPVSASPDSEEENETLMQ
ncbi:MAG: hypothetical protein Q4D07_01310 [Selenomonadaceae bacterium]|nr:hypothetical protein [Selenomonadaceae bacterium]